MAAKLMEINLKRLVTKKDVISLITDLVDAPLSILDPDGKVILGAGDAGQVSSHAIKLNGQVIGWVAGEKKAAAVASLISCLAESELEKKALGRETLEKYKEINLLYDITDKMAANTDPIQVARMVIEDVKRIIKADNISLMLFNEEIEQFAIVAALGEEKKNKSVFMKGKGIVGSIAASGKGEIINDVASDARFIPGPAKISSMMCAPLKIKDKAIGVINVSSVEPASYTAEELKLLNALAFQAGAAIENARLYSALKETFLTAVQALAETIEKRDPYTGGHTKRVMGFSLVIGKELGLSAEVMEQLKLAAILHDIGKIGVRDKVLLKNGKLNDEEFAEIKKHPVYGQEMLQHIKYFKNIIPGVKFHHERFDGRGYPEGLQGDQIHIIARIIAVADTFDAMTSSRPYRTALGNEVALEELQRCAGTQFDPEVVNAFLQAYANNALFETEVKLNEQDFNSG